MIERDFPGADIHVRGNEITVTGPADETALVDRLFEELTTMVARGTELSADAGRAAPSRCCAAARRRGRTRC